jgi:hypothetical protein
MQLPDSHRVLRALIVLLAKHYVLSANGKQRGGWHSNSGIIANKSLTSDLFNSSGTHIAL